MIGYYKCLYCSEPGLHKPIALCEKCQAWYEKRMAEMPADWKCSDPKLEKDQED